MAMKAMRTMITIIANRISLEKEDVEYFNACRIAENVYLTSKTPQEVKNALYGAGYDCDAVLVSKLEKECYDTLKDNDRIVIK